MTETKRQSNRTPRVARPQQRLLTIRQGEVETGIPYNSLRDLIVRGHLPAVRLPESRRTWIRREDLDALIARSVEAVSA